MTYAQQVKWAACSYLQVMEDQLKNHEWLAADQYSIADIANFAWVYIHTWSGVSSTSKSNHLIAVLWECFAPYQCTFTK